MVISERCAFAIHSPSAAVSPGPVQESTETFTLSPISTFPNSDSFLSWVQHRSSKGKTTNADNEATCHNSTANPRFTSCTTAYSYFSVWSLVLFYLRDRERYPLPTLFEGFPAQEATVVCIMKSHFAALVETWMWCLTKIKKDGSGLTQTQPQQLLHTAQRHFS